MRSEVFVFTLLYSCFGLAQEFGFLKVNVLQPNPAHNTNVRLHLNQKLVAEFAHSRAEELKVSIRKEFLVAGGSTALQSDYGSLQKGCHFNYTVSFSYDGRSWISLGTYHAPTTNLNTRLPLGFCGEEVCSSNGSVQAQIDRIKQERWEKNAKAVEDWLNEAIANREKELEQELENERVPDATQFDSEFANEFKTYQASLDTARDSLSGQVVGGTRSIQEITAEALQSGTLEQMIAKTQQSDWFVSSCQAGNATMQSYCVRYGGYGWVFAASDALALAYAAEPDREVIKGRFLDPDAASKLRTLKERNAEIRQTAQRMVLAKQSEEFWNSVASTARTGVAFTPLNDIADFCEAVTGRVFCRAEGEPLTDSQRFLAVIGIIAGSRVVWEGLSDSLKVSLSPHLFDELSGPQTKILLKDLNRVVVRSADEVNSLLKKRFSSPPYKPGTRVWQFTTHTALEGLFVRVSVAGSQGYWMMEKGAIQGLTPRQIKNKFALPAVPKFVADVSVPAGTVLRKGIPNPIFGSDGKAVGIQYEIASELNPGLSLERIISAARPLEGS